VAAFTTVRDVAGRSYEFVPDGVYFDLPEELYFAQDALGSSDLIRLWKHKHGWWWSSRWNPDRVEPGPPPSGIYGHGTHAMVLEGPGAYASKFAVQPSARPERPDDGGQDVQRGAERGGFSLRGRRAGWPRIGSPRPMNLPTVPCWPNMLAEFAGRPAPTGAAGADRRRGPHAADHVPGGDGQPGDCPPPRGAGSGFPPLAEVSVLRTARRDPPALAVRPAVPGVHHGPEDARQLGGPAAQVRGGRPHRPRRLRHSAGRL
jgi:hypothetical protein